MTKKYLDDHGLETLVEQIKRVFAKKTDLRWKAGDDENSTVNIYGGSKASAAGAVAQGQTTVASAPFAHAEGISTTASGYQSHAEGSLTVAANQVSHAEGFSTTALGAGAHAEGDHTSAVLDHSHAEGLNTTAYGSGSHAEGLETYAYGEASHAEGIGTTASENYSTVVGSYNDPTLKDYYFAVGIGDRNTSKTGFYVDKNGNAYAAYDVTATDIDGTTVSLLEIKNNLITEEQIIELFEGWEPSPVANSKVRIIFKVNFDELPQEEKDNDTLYLIIDKDEDDEIYTLIEVYKNGLSADIVANLTEAQVREAAAILSIQ